MFLKATSVTFLKCYFFLLLANLHFKLLKCFKKQEVCVNKTEHPQGSGWLNYFLREALQGRQFTQAEMKDRPLEAVAATAGTNKKNSITGSKSLTVFYLALNNSMKRLLACSVFSYKLAKFCWKMLKTQKKLVKRSVVFVDKRKWWFISVSLQVVQSSSPIVGSIICCIEKLCNKYSILNLGLVCSYIKKTQTEPKQNYTITEWLYVSVLQGPVFIFLR